MINEITKQLIEQYTQMTGRPIQTISVDEWLVFRERAEKELLGNQQPVYAAQPMQPAQKVQPSQAIAAAQPADKPEGPTAPKETSKQETKKTEAKEESAPKKTQEKKENKDIIAFSSGNTQRKAASSQSAFERDQNNQTDILMNIMKNLEG